jgi:aminoglycoside phosphotransferase (APT) family kinase protein
MRYHKRVAGGGTPRAAEPAGIEVAAVTAWLANALPDLAPPLAFAAIGHGRSNLTYRVADADGRTWVLRRPPLGHLLASAHDMRREHRILAALAPAGATVPKPLALCEDEDVTGAPFFVMEDVPGLVVHRTQVAALLGEHERRATMTSLVTSLAQLHALDVDAIGLGDLGPREAYAQRQLRRWLRQWEDSKTRELPLVAHLGERLAGAAPPQRETALVHGDFRLDNAIVGADGHVRAILDWELTALGDPLADLGLLLAYTPRSAEEAIPIHDPVTLLPGFPTHEQLVATYARASGRDVTPLPFWIALGCWKVAVILQGVYRRWQEDPRNGGEGAGQLEPVVEWLLARADATAREAGF